jgi:rhamnose transport system ATP-binding protein
VAPSTQPHASGSQVPAVEYRAVDKRFQATHALKAVDMTIEPSTIHALVGENGAGKSTCLGVLAGRIAPDSGRVEVFGTELKAFDPRTARAAGVAAIYQELTIVPALSAQANVFLGQSLSKHGLLAERQMRRRYEALCEELGVTPAPANAPARSLSVADHQLLEIMRAIVTRSRIILFDEPTTSLAPPEREALRRLMLKLRDQGVTLVFVSHNLDEVLRIADTVSVFRDGRVVLTADRSDLTKRQLVEAMLGAGVGARLADQLLGDASSARKARPAPREGLLRVEDLTVPGAVEDIGFEVRRGEIFGIGGLVGAGRTTILRALAGLERRASGRLWVEGRKVPWPTSVRKSRRLGIALSPEDRKTQGLALQMSAMDNIAISDLGRVARGPLLSKPRMAAECGEVATKFGFDRARIDETARRLSGGNQQKLLLARWGFNPPKVLLADEPTRGVDIGAKQGILASLEAMAANGSAIVVVSSEIEEIAAICDRVLVISEGRVSGVLDRERDEMSVSQIIKLAFGMAGNVA